jgi:hypothetical protein
MSELSKQSLQERRDEVQAEEKEAARLREEASKRTWTITSPNKGYGDEFAGVTFVDGVGVAAGDNFAALNYFMNHPFYTVEPGGDLPEAADETDLERTQRLQFLDRTTAHDALLDEASKEAEKPKPASSSRSKADSK